jgi:hypothetical protein
MDTSPRPLGRSGLQISPFGLGCWPIAGMTREGITREAAVATIAASNAAGQLNRVRAAILLVMAAPEYLIQK